MECTCGSDATFRFDVLCPKHDAPLKKVLESFQDVADVTGAGITKEDVDRAIALADEHDFVPEVWKVHRREN